MLAWSPLKQLDPAKFWKDIFLLLSLCSFAKPKYQHQFFPLPKIICNELFTGNTCTDGGLISESLSTRTFQPNPIPSSSLGEIFITQRLQQGQNSEWILKSCQWGSNCTSQDRRPDCAEGAWQALALL